MEQVNAVVWAHHGLFCSGTDFDETFGLMHTIEKSAEILIKVLSVTPHKRQTITTEDFIALAEDFHVTLNPSGAASKRLSGCPADQISGISLK